MFAQAAGNARSAFRVLLLPTKLTAPQATLI